MEALYKFINWYTQHHRFPRKGWKYFRRLLRLFRLDSRIYIKKLFNGTYIRVNPVDHIQKELFWYGHYERISAMTWLSFINKDSIILDIGANIGYYSLLASKKAVAGMIYAFEPATLIREELERNIRMNRLSNIQVLPWCISDATRQMEFYLADETNRGMSGLGLPENYAGEKETVSCISLDNWVNNTGFTKIDLIKMDIEGAELMALKGMQETLGKYSPVIFMEIEPSLLSKFGSSAEDVYKFLHSINYRPYEIMDINCLAPARDYREGSVLVFVPEGMALPEDVE